VAKTNGNPKDDLIIVRAQKRLKKRLAVVGSLRALAKELGVNHKYVIDLFNGCVPSNVNIRRALGLPRSMPSECRPRVARVIPLLGSDGWEKVFFKRLRPRKWRIV
jgi:hypothetical protein